MPETVLWRPTMDNLEWKPDEPGWWYYVPPARRPATIYTVAWICYLRGGGEFYRALQLPHRHAYGTERTLEAARHAAETALFNNR
jgi:hypothetical protein